MRTVIDLADELLRAAQSQAAAAGERLESLVERAIAREVGIPSNALHQGAVEYPLIRSRRVAVDLDPQTLEQVLTDDEAEVHTI